MNNFDRGPPRDHSCLVWSKSNAWFQRRCCLKKLLTHGRWTTDNGPSQKLTLSTLCSGELKSLRTTQNIFPVAQRKNVLYFCAKSNQQYQRLTEIIHACVLRIDFNTGLLEKYCIYLFHCHLPQVLPYGLPKYKSRI